MRSYLSLVAAPALLATALTANVAVANVQGPTVYGLIHLSVDQINSGIKGDKQSLNVSSNTSSLGIRGSFDIDANLKLLYQAQGLVYMTEGGHKSNTFRFDQDTFAGFKGGWGLVRIGNMNSPTKLLRVRTDLFSTQVGAAGNITGADGQDNWRRNSVYYTSPQFNGFTAKAQYSTNNADEGYVTSYRSVAYSASLEFEEGPLWLAVAYDEDKDLNGNDINVKAYRAAASLDLNDDVRLNLIYSHDNKSSLNGSSSPANSDVYGIGLRVQATQKVALKTQVHHLQRDKRETNDNKKPKATQYAIGADYQYAPNLMFYANFAQTDNDGVYRAPTNAGRTAAITLSDSISKKENPWAVSVGTLFRF